MPKINKHLQNMNTDNLPINVNDIRFTSELFMAYGKKLLLTFNKLSGYRPSAYFNDAMVAKHKILANFIETILSELIEMLQVLYNLPDSINCLRELITLFDKMGDRYTETYSLDKIIENIAENCINYTQNLNVDFLVTFANIHRNNIRKIFPDGKFHFNQEDGQLLTPDNYKENAIEIYKLASTADYMLLGSDNLIYFVKGILGKLVNMVSILKNNGKYNSANVLYLLELINSGKSINVVANSSILFYNNNLYRQAKGVVNIGYYCLDTYTKLKMI